MHMYAGPTGTVQTWGHESTPTVRLALPWGLGVLLAFVSQWSKQDK